MDNDIEHLRIFRPFGISAFLAYCLEISLCGRTIMTSSDESRLSPWFGSFDGLSCGAALDNGEALVASYVACRLAAENEMSYGGCP